MGNNKRKSHSMKSRLLLPMTVVVLVQAVIYFAAVSFSSTFQHMEKNSYNLLNNGTASVSEKMERNLLDIRSSTASYAEKIAAKLQDYAVKNELSLRSQADVEQNSSRLIEQAADEIFALLHNTASTGAFLILENGDSRKPAFYIRDQNPGMITSNNADIMGVAGPAALLRKYQIALDSDWIPRLDFERASSASFYEEPFQVATEYPDLETEDMGYWEGLMRLTGNGIQFVSYTVPLLDSDGVPYGVLGIEISAKYLLSWMDYHTLNMENDGAFVLNVFRSGEENSDVLLVNGPLMKRELGRNLNLRFEKTESVENIYQVYHTNFQEDVTGSLQYLKLYNTNTPFSGQRWAVGGIVERSALLKDIYSLKRLLFAAFLIALVLGILITLRISQMIVAPLADLMANLRGSDPSREVRLDKTQVSEIDELAGVIEKLSVDVANSASRLSQIIDMVSLPLGALEYNKVTGALFCTDGIYELLDFSEEFRKQEPKSAERTLQEFDVFRQRVKGIKTADDKARVALLQTAEGKRWLRFLKKDLKEVVLVVVQDVTKETIEMEKLEYERDYDVLTNLLNRRAFQREAQRVMASGEYPLIAAVMWDLDNLKYINDSYGHDYGDRYIQEAARIFGQLGSSQALICRRSGDEFVALLFSQSDKEAYRRMVGEVHNRLAETSVELPDSKEMKLRASGGLAWYPEDGAGYSELMKYMDFAMYDAKHKAKGSLREFDRKIYERDQLLLNGTEALNQLLEGEVVKYAFQPIVSTVDGEIFAYEALMRPQVINLKSPVDVMRLAKDQSKMYQIEQMTWRCALRDFSVQIEKSGNSRLFLNSVPNTHLSQTDYERIEEQYGSLMDRVVVEMIESEQQEPESLEIKQTYRDRRGIQIALDDFGTGYSTEGVLLEIKPDYVKIDISIIAGIHKDKDRQSLLSNILRFAGPRGIRIIAEGVETYEEMEYLIQVGVDYLQGYYLARPEFELCEIPEAKKKEIQNCNRR